jgi:signal transduction histidine kinase
VSEGNGVVSLRRRARALGGKIEVSSSAGQGTTLTIKIPHRRHFGFRDRVGM